MSKITMTPADAMITLENVKGTLGEDLDNPDYLAVLDALAGWARLSPDPLACRIDRIVVYRAAQAHMARTPALSLPGLLQDFDHAGITIEAENLRRSLSRLQLAYVLMRDADGEQLRFAVPLFAMQFQPGEVDALLERELRSMREECNG